MTLVTTPRPLFLVLAMLLAACDPVGDGLALKAETVLPPGQSGFFSNEGQSRGQQSGNPGDYGDHVDDQRLMYWSFDAKRVSPLGQKPGPAVSPKAGIEIYRDDYGVPIVYASTTRDLWFGVAYAIAEDRLFEMDAVRRLGEGTLAALAGCGAVPDDIQQRIITYTDEEYDSFFQSMSQEAKDFFLGYVDGANAWLDVVATNPDLLPAEYSLLSATPEPFTLKGALAGGVYITRFVAAEGGGEFLNIRMIKELEEEYGSREAALDAFLDMIWLDDPKAATTVPKNRTFSNQALPESGDRETVFRGLVDWALELPETLWKGNGTGDAADVGSCGGLPVASKSKSTTKVAKADTETKTPATIRATAEKTRKARVLVAALTQEQSKSGHSFALAIGPQRTRDGGTLLISEPQLTITYPNQLVEYEIHGAGYDARGSSVPLLPTVGIGFTNYAAWAITTGYSKTIDSFIETTCSNDQQAAEECSANQYFHKDQWKDMDCRTETVFYRESQQGAPVGTADFSEDYEVCRTVHGPIVARDDAAGLARSVQYAMWKKEVGTIEGIIHWNRAKTFTDFFEGIKKVSWNENIAFATRDGHYGYVHPGLFPRRHPETDMRLPTPGEGDFDMGDYMAFSELPQAIDLPVGFVANWNNRPAVGWLDGEGFGSTSRPGGVGQRVTNLQDIVATRDDWTFADLRNIDIYAGTIDPRAREYLPVISSFQVSATLDAVQKAVVDRMLAWDRRHYNLEIDIEDPEAKDTPGATIFHEYVIALREELFGGLQDNILDPGTGKTVFAQVSGVGSHKFDQGVMDNLVIRVLNPESSGLALRSDFTGGRSRDEVMKSALEVVMQRLAGTYNEGAEPTIAAIDTWTRIHPHTEMFSLTKVIGPGSTTPSGEPVRMPYQDRGAWVHRVGYEK